MHSYINDWSYGWGWILWLGFIFLLFSGLGNWGYTYSAHRKYAVPRKEAGDILNERYAAGELTRDEYRQVKSDIAGSSSIPAVDAPLTQAESPWRAG